MSIAAKMFRQLVLSAMLAACTTGDELGADAGPGGGGGGGMDAAPYDGSEPKCQPARAAAPVTLDGKELASGGPATWIADAEGGVLAVAPGVDGHGYQISRFTSLGEASGPAWVAFPSALAATQLSVAAVGGVLALAEQGAELAAGTSTARASCSLSLVRWQDQRVVRAPMRVSDPTEDESILNETVLCEVAAMPSGFVVVWQQFVSRSSDDARLFAQRVALDGSLLGERLTLLPNTIGKLATVAMAGDDARTVVVYRGANQAEASLAFIEPDAVQVKPLPEVDMPFRALARAHDGYLLRTSSSLWRLDREGQVVGQPYAIASDALAAPLGEGYALVDHEEFLVARALDPSLSKSSEPLGITDQRSAQAEALVSTPEGDDTRLIYREDGEIKLQKLSCGTTVEPLGPKACRRAVDLQPLESGCSDPVCHVVIRLDYLTLGVLGWSVSGGPLQSVDIMQATQTSQDVFTTNSEYITNPPDKVTGPDAGLYSVSASPSDFGGFALVGAQSGIVVAAGGVVWGGRGNYWIPSAWRPASDIYCGDTQVWPAEQLLDAAECYVEQGASTSASEAMRVALSTNLALGISSQGELKARAYLYTPTTGSCNAGDAEWLVVLTRESL